MLKAQLAASEAMVKQLTKEKWEAVDATRRLKTNWQTALAEIEKLKASALGEDDETPVVAPPSEAVWFAGSTKPPRVQNFESESASCGPSVEPNDPQDREAQGTKEKDEGTPVVSPSSEAVSVAGSTKKLQVPDIRIAPPAPSDADSEEVVDSSPFNTTTSTSYFPAHDYLSPTPQSTPSRQRVFKGLGLRLRVPHPIRWLRARRQRDLIDLKDPLSESPARKVHNARMRVLQAQANGPAHSRWVAYLANDA
ncbi:hypothetical protein FRC04_007894 [Tulasnella sp. 424]|nr:hypothetical protein FRC04_007894 [Tulasnella sp. 424]KAG8975078.1 hypothetical protein FRC05_006501 [Tulasnella sp. 425]